MFNRICSSYFQIKIQPNKSCFINMVLPEQICYTLIGGSKHREPLNEMKVREDLEKGTDKV